MLAVPLPRRRRRRQKASATAITSAIWAVLAWIILGGVITRADISNLDQWIR